MIIIKESKEEIPSRSRILWLILVIWILRSSFFPREPFIGLPEGDFSEEITLSFIATNFMLGILGTSPDGFLTMAGSLTCGMLGSSSFEVSVLPGKPTVGKSLCPVSVAFFLGNAGVSVAIGIELFSMMTGLGSLRSVFGALGFAMDWRSFEEAPLGFHLVCRSFAFPRRKSRVIAMKLRILKRFLMFWEWRRLLMKSIMNMRMMQTVPNSRTRTKKRADAWETPRWYSNMMACHSSLRKTSEVAIRASPISLKFTLGDRSSDLFYKNKGIKFRDAGIKDYTRKLFPPLFRSPC